ncbi:hypothetical protein SAMD00019534_029070, partial [Acytostelium subglobosum LB1]|uniref:hypothetical protein n=1 Tax=Acytostelium subglobosum LB1 TaxID=1410327 RepID=UPI000644D0CC
MKVTIKNVNKEVYIFELNGNEKVIDLKNMITETHKHQQSWQTLIYSGKILENDNTIASYNITESGFIVCMVKKPKEESASLPAAPVPAPPPVQVPATPAPATNPAQPPQTPVSAPNTNVVPNAPVRPVTQPREQRESNLTPEQEATIKQIVEMGFAREQAIGALRAAYNNADRAVELLLAGGEFVGDDDEDDQIYDDEDDQIDDDEDDDLLEGDDPMAVDGIIDEIRNSPYFPAIRESFIRNPSMIPELLQQLSQTNPELVRRIAENPQAFIRLFNNDAAPGERGQTVQIQLTQEESDAIDRLISLGFDKDEVLEAYLACEKDEQLTASYLFER